MKRMWTGWILVMTLAASAVPALARQEGPGLELVVRRDFGYGGGARIQGAFSLTVSGREDLMRVVYLIDGQEMGVVSEPPFRFRFNTGDYPLGEHTLVAVATTMTGEEIRTPGRSFEFVSAEEGWRAAARFGLPLIGLAVLITLASALGPVLAGRRSKGFRPGEYGAIGGAVCPRCGLPFSRHVLSLNMLMGKLERCPHCGKWSIARRATADELKLAEARWAADKDRGALAIDDEKDRLQRMVDESRFEQ